MHNYVILVKAGIQRGGAIGAPSETWPLHGADDGLCKGPIEGEGVNGCIFVGGWTLLLLKYSCSRGWRVFGWMLVELAGPIAAPIHPHRDPLLISPWRDHCKTPRVSPVPTGEMSEGQCGASKRSPEDRQQSGVCPGWRRAYQPNPHHPIQYNNRVQSLPTTPSPLRGRGLG